MKKIISILLISSTIICSGTNVVLAKNIPTQKVKVVQTENKHKYKEPLAKIVYKTRSMTGEITGDKVRLRKSPGLKGEIITELKKGTLVTAQHGQSYIKADGYSWMYVTVQATGQSGYVAVDYVDEVG